MCVCLHSFMFLCGVANTFGRLGWRIRFGVGCVYLYRSKINNHINYIVIIL